MKPTIGRIVIYNTTEAERKAMTQDVRPNDSNSAEKLPAVIVSIFSETCVNLKVILDGNGPDLWKTSAPLGDLEGNWNWPVIER